MPQPSPHVDTYLNLARELAANYRQPESFLVTAAQLPPVTAALQRELWEMVESVWYGQPQLGWALTAVGEAAAQETSNLKLQADAALHLARAANHWFHPQYAKDAARRARLLFQERQDHFGAAAAEIEHFSQTGTFLDIEEVRQRLESALESLTLAPEAYLPNRMRGKLALAFAYGLQQDFENAARLLTECQSFYQADANPYALARICQIRAGQATMRSDYAQQNTLIDTGLKLIEPLGLSPFYARLETLKFYGVWVTSGNYGEVVSQFIRIKADFQRMGIDRWAARIDNYIGQIRWAQSNLSEAYTLISRSQQMSTQLGDSASVLWSLVDLSNIQRALGNYESCIDYALQGSLIAESNGRWTEYCLSIMNQGWAYFHLGQFQKGLIYLERSHEIAQKKNLVVQQIGAEIWLAQYWLALNQPEKFQAYLNSAESLARDNNQQEFIFEIFEQLVRYWLANEPPDDFEARMWFQIARFEQLEQPYYAAELKRQLGNYLNTLGQFEDGTALLRSALSFFSTAGRTQNEALSWLNLGDSQERQGLAEVSLTSWERSLELSRSEPHIRWQAASRIADVYAIAERFDAAIALFEEAVGVLTSIRQNIWQLSLIGNYTQRSIDVFNAAVRLAFQQQDDYRLFKFMEAAKAHTLNARLLRLQTEGEAAATESQVLLARRQQLEERQRAFQELNPILKRRQRKALMAEIRQFSDLFNQQQRRQVALDPTSALPETETLSPALFDLDGIRTSLRQRFGEAWKALVFYIDAARLTGMLLTPKTIVRWQRQLSPKIDQVLAHFQAGLRDRLEEKELASLGAWLLPDELKDGLEPHTQLLIAPHGRLHALPFPALTFSGKPLIEQCVITITPTLTTHLLLSDRSHQPEDLTKGVIFAISEFDGRYPSLPAVRQEQQSLLSQLSPQSQIYREEEATWTQLQKMARENQLQHYNFFHFSSHAEFNPQTPLAPLNGLAFADKTVGLDQLQDIRLNLPLVTLAACSGLNSHQAAGDEHSGIGINFLEAGARAVVGALWPIQDEAAAVLLPRFYHHYFLARDSVHALALTQREAIAAASPWQDWGILLHIGHGV